MRREIETKFFTFHQNNSGGYYITDDEHGICETVIIEAVSADEAWNKLNKIGENVSGMHDYCACCGERWYECWNDDTETPEVFGEKVEEVKAMTFKNKTFVHYFDGTIKLFNHKTE